MSDKLVFRLPAERPEAVAALARAPDGYVAEVRPPRRNSDQNRKFHAICRDVANSGVTWDGEPQTEDAWKFLLVSGHAIATKRPGKLMLGIEGERVMLRPSTAAMSVAEMTSLIEYSIAWATQRGIPLSERGL